MLFIKNEHGQIIKLHGTVKVFDDSDSFTWSVKLSSTTLKDIISDYIKKQDVIFTFPESESKIPENKL